MSLYSSMCCFIFKISFWRNKYRSHHRKGAISSCYHITHNITIIIFASPNKTTLRTDNSCYCIINQGIKISNAYFFKFLFILFFIDLLKNIFKCMIVFFRNSIFCCKPEILFCIYSKIKAASCKTFY